MIAANENRVEGTHGRVYLISSDIWIINRRDFVIQITFFCSTSC
ncbi:hypothetical protein HMPREF0083_06233 [Aneurinibacillus aneurinilyticus ATCC 12856]|uniref:Uncharacterized protein n=1 Tax=Aneurinibacillus aneurinilyticus ATCC 12856 TaxID=649747 RepID=U1WMT3_ANEAE|nr:hypothetical protein HMPREF0083_06233 [Aneurinibacillus aneurinilyticus ATCC 12856]